ncbi:uncharacterized protein LOC121730986 [Aricia agestis]|uniref:uncharacterized protein LOC121730986 n=1 Tax=Aricia agestis TaxID=91739 RepID=UPI001C207D1C|nr:uncharacterized protein LOC121730986 [Aricia agestis]
MSRALVLVALVCVGLASARPVRKTLNFNMFFLKPQDSTERTVVTADGISRFGPILEYLVQRVQNVMSVRLPPKEDPSGAPEQQVPHADPAENDIDSPMASESKMLPGVVVRPSRTRPGTYEVEIDVVVDEEAPQRQS